MKPNPLAGTILLLLAAAVKLPARQLALNATRTGVVQYLPGFIPLTTIPDFEHPTLEQAKAAYNFDARTNLRQAVLPQAVRHWTLTTLREKLIKIGANVARHSRRIANWYPPAPIENKSRWNEYLDWLTQRLV